MQENIVQLITLKKSRKIYQIIDVKNLEKYICNIIKKEQVQFILEKKI